MLVPPLRGRQTAKGALLLIDVACQKLSKVKLIVAARDACVIDPDKRLPREFESRCGHQCCQGC